MHARLHPHHIGDLTLDPGVQGDDEIDCRRVRRRKSGDQRLQPRPALIQDHEGRQVLRQLGRIGEGQGLGIGLGEEIEWVDHRHFGGEVDRDAELPRGLGKHNARQPVAVGVLLPVDEVRGRRDRHRVAGDARSGVGRGPQSHDMRAEGRRLVVPVTRHMI